MRAHIHVQLIKQIKYSEKEEEASRHFHFWILKIVNMVLNIKNGKDKSEIRHPHSGIVAWPAAAPHSNPLRALIGPSLCRTIRDFGNMMAGDRARWYPLSHEPKWMDSTILLT